MEEASLDDFFAKKDKSKKKSKSKTKYTPSDILGDDQVQEQKVKKLKKKRDKDKTSQPDNKESDTTNTEKSVEQSAAEWNETHHEDEVDYTGLKLAQISTRENEEDGENAEDRGSDEDGEDGEKKDEVSGPWRGTGVPPTMVPVKQPEPEPKPAEPEPAKEESKPSGLPSKYVPPGRRGAGAVESATSQARPLVSRKKKVAPNIQSELDFPSLGGMRGDADTVHGSQFEEVRSGGRKQTDDSSNRRQDLQLGNQFDALSSVDS